MTSLTLILLTWRIWRAPNNVSKWQMGFNVVFKGLRSRGLITSRDCSFSLIIKVCSAAQFPTYFLISWYRCSFHWGKATAVWSWPLGFTHWWYEQVDPCLQYDFVAPTLTTFSLSLTGYVTLQKYGQSEVCGKTACDVSCLGAALDCSELWDLWIGQAVTVCTSAELYSVVFSVSGGGKVFIFYFTFVGKR